MWIWLHWRHSTPSCATASCHRSLTPSEYPGQSGTAYWPKSTRIHVQQVAQQAQAHAWHTVRSGETLGAIARRYRTSVNGIMQANNLKSSHLIRAGTRLKIPQRGGCCDRTGAASDDTAPASGIHTVVTGDSLWNIANRYGTTVQRSWPSTACLPAACKSVNG
jgi:LysM repeat protein